MKLRGLIILAMALARCSSGEFSGTGESTAAKNNPPKNPDKVVTEQNEDPNESLETDSGGGTSIRDCTEADIITFESLGEPNLQISDQYKSSHGVTFSQEDGRSPLLAKLNSSTPTAWSCENCLSPNTNKARDDQTEALIEQFFLMQNENVNPTLIITYNSLVKEASGYLIDIDNGETFVVTALNSEMEPLDSQNYAAEPGDTTYDGKARQWKIERSSNEIKQIKIEGSKTRSNGSINVNFGFAFDRFSPSKICD